jgi:hypothetical protein
MPSASEQLLVISDQWWLGSPGALRSRVLDQGPIWRDAAVFVSLSSQADDGGRTTDDG